MDQFNQFLKALQGWLSGAGVYALNKLLPALLILAAGILIVRLIMRGINKLLEKSRLEKAAHSLIKAVLRFVLYGLLCLMLASHLGIDVTGVIALASVLTLAISLSVQNALTNVISGFTLIYTDPFSSGDYVEIAGQSGSVLEIGLTYTKLATPDNKIVYIPNGSVTSAEIVNYTVTGTRRMDINVSVSYESPVEQVLEALREAGNVPTILEEKGIFVAVSNYGESAINYVLRVWSKTDEFWSTQYEINKRIKAILDDRGLKMTYPHLNVHLDK